MALEQKLSLKLAQKLVMTPSLQQAIKLLQMTRMELETLVTQELVENPVLEETSEAPEDVNDRNDPESGDKEPEDNGLDDSIENIDLDAYFGEYWESSGYPSMHEHREDYRMENNLTQEPDLYDHLLWQLHMTDTAPRLREIAETIIGNLNPDGFLVASLEELCDAGLDVSGELEEPYPEEEVLRALELVRSFEPSGVACRDLQESLLHQLLAEVDDAAEEGRGPTAEASLAAPAEADPDEAAEALPESAAEEDDDDLDLPPEVALAIRLIRDHWDLFLRRQFPAIAKTLGVELEALRPAVEKIKTLETRPGRRFSSDRAHYIEPDVHVYRVGQEYVIQLNDDGLPRLRVSRAYRRMLQRMRNDASQSEAQQFIKEKMRSAIWLIKSLDQRQRTIYKVANSIVHQQREFLDHGIDHLRPMVLRDVAEDIGMHESTVSRVVSNKYIHTPRGVFPMKFFFHSGIDREYGDNISSLTVKRKIEQMIQGEDPKRPLSDSELMRVLNREGIQIARRTVAKYRDELSIPSSTERKKIF
ncbi:MAG: RNA polymerase factor sigma-54 [Acidobacteriota bacterium]